MAAAAELHSVDEADASAGARADAVAIHNAALNNSDCLGMSPSEEHASVAYRSVSTANAQRSNRKKRPLNYGLTAQAAGGNGTQERLEVMALKSLRKRTPCVVVRRRRFRRLSEGRSMLGCPHMLSLRIPPPIWLLLAGALMWILDRFLPVRTVLVAPWNRLGWCLMAAALLPALAAMTQFMRAGTTINPHVPAKASTLVTEGVYRWTRNPMYLGLLLLLVGWAIDLGSLSPFLIPPLFALVLAQVQILPEERVLRARFGVEYDRYCRTTGRWLGRRGR